MIQQLSVIIIAFLPYNALSFFQFGGGNSMPKLYDGWFNGQIAKQAQASVSKAIASGKMQMEVNFPPVPNLEEVRFGTPLNQKLGKDVISKNLKIEGGYKAGSNVSRNLVAYSNIYWAKQIASSINKKPVCVVTTEPVKFAECKSMGDLSRYGTLVMNAKTKSESRKNESVICINPGGEETWKRISSAYQQNPNCPIIMLNNAYSTTYDLGNKQNFEEVYFLKRISKGWVYRAYPGKWQAYIEKPDGDVELLKTYETKPALNEVATFVREESFRRYAMNNDRYAKGFGGRI